MHLKVYKNCRSQLGTVLVINTNMHVTVDVLLMISNCAIILLIVMCFLCRLMSQFVDASIQSSVGRLMSQFVDANIQSSVGMFTFIMSYFIYAVMRTIFY